VHLQVAVTECTATHNLEHTAARDVRCLLAIMVHVASKYRHLMVQHVPVVRRNIQRREDVAGIRKLDMANDTGLAIAV
jgi:phage terminase Nu1 subunit (DNA packaging protein)